MRIAAMVLGLMLSAWTFFEAFLVSIFSGGDDDRAAAAGGGLVSSLIGALGAALAIAFPLASAILFGLASLVGYSAAAAGYGNHYLYATLYALLAVVALFGWRGKRRERQEKDVELRRQHERDDRLEQLLRNSQQPKTIQCTSCGRLNPPDTRFCGTCGTALTSLPPTVSPSPEITA